MTIPFEARINDLFNLVIAKGSNFILTITLFAVISNGMSATDFSDFGYWWSISIMAGGIIFGGLASSIIREVTAVRSIRHLKKPICQIFFGVLAFLAVIGILIAATQEFFDTGTVIITAVFFGIAVQTQTIFLSLLRAIEATRENVAISGLLIVLVPAFVIFYLDTDRNLGKILQSLTFGFATGTIFSMIISKRRLEPLWKTSNYNPIDLKRFYRTVFSFTVVNIFSFSIVNIDFTIFKIFGTTDDFSVMATAKIFFERFALPLVMVFLGAVSLRVLRYEQQPLDPELRITVNISARFLLGTLFILGFSVLAYWIFVHFYRNDTIAIDPLWVACVILGYLLYAFNGVLLDLLVLRKSSAEVVVTVLGFLAFATLIQTLSIHLYGVKGWAGGWLSLNLSITLYLSKRSVRFL